MTTSLLLIDYLPTPELVARYKTTFAGMGEWSSPSFWKAWLMST